MESLRAYTFHRSMCALFCFSVLSLVVLLLSLGSGFFFQAEDGIRDLVRSRGLGDVYKRQLSRASCAISCGAMLSSTAMP